MKKFIGKITIFFILALITCSILPLYLYSTNLYGRFVTGKDLYYSINKSKKRNPQKKLILGDSVADQLFPNTEKDSTYVSLACNQAIEMCGHFLLLNNYLMANNQVDTVYFIYHPINFGHNLNQGYTFHYFIKPFCTDEYKPYLTKNVQNQIAKIPYHNMARMIYISTSNWAPNYVCTDTVPNFMSTTSLEYLNQMKALENKYHFQLILVPEPLNIAMKGFVDHIDKSVITQNGLDKEFEQYFKNIIYLDDNYFYDGLHLKQEYIKQFANLYIKKFGI